MTAVVGVERHDLSDRFEYEGLWWLPDSPDNQVPGTLSFDGQVCTLKVFGLLRSPTELGRRDLYRREVILGNTEEGRVTLCPAFATEYPMFGTAENVPPEQRQPLRSSYLITDTFVGAHLRTRSEIRFGALSVGFTDLDEWMMRPDTALLQRERRDQGKSVSYAAPRPHVVRVRAMDSELIFGWALAGSSSSRSVHWEPKSYVAIRPDSEKRFGWYLDVLRDLRYLLTLLVGRPVHVNRVTAHRKDECRTVEDRGLRLPVRALTYEHSYFLSRSEPWPSDWHWRNVLIPLKDVEADLEAVVNAWFDKAEKLRLVWTSFFQTLGRSGGSTESDFLSLTQSLEIYHSRTFPDDPSVGGEPSLHVRMEKLLQRSGHGVRPMILRRGEDAEGFAQKVADTRNYLVHGNRKKGRRAFMEREYYNANRRLQLLMIASLLLDLGIEYGQVADAVDRFADTYFADED